jgi:hypothetical protein
MFLFVAALIVSQSDTPANFKPRTESFDYIKRGLHRRDVHRQSAPGFKGSSAVRTHG